MWKEVLITLKTNMTSLVNGSRKKKTWQSGIGIVIFTLFVLSSLFINQTVQALNKAAGNYGYYLGTYGYNASHASSDYVPSAPTSVSCSASSTSAGTCSWTAPTTTTEGTSLDNLDHYLYNSSTSSITSCTSGTTASSATLSLTGLTQNTSYYVAVCAVDTNGNEGSVATGSFTTMSYSGGGSSGGVANNTITTPAPATTTTTTTTTTTEVSVLTPTVVADAAQLVAQLGVTRDTAMEATYQPKVEASVKEFGVKLAATDVTTATNFVTYGVSAATIKLGSGERLALVRDQLETLGRLSLTALDQIANGEKPTERNLTKEVAQVGKVLKVFEALTGHRPNFKNSSEDLAWNTMMYRIRFARDLNQEKVGIVKFKSLYNRIPKSPLDWAAVRAWGYALKK